MKHLFFIALFTYSLFAMDKESLRPFIESDNVLCTIPLLLKEQQREIALILSKLGTAENIQDILRKKIKEMHDIIISGAERDPKILCNIGDQNNHSYKVSFDANYILIMNTLYRVIKPLTKYEMRPAEYSFSNKDKLVSYDTNKKILTIYELGSNKLLYEVPCENTNNWHFNAQDTILAVFNKNNNLKLYNAINGTLLITLENVKRYSHNTALLFNPNNTQIIIRAPDPDKIIVWDTQKNEPTLLNENVAAFNPDGSFLAIANGKKTSLYKSQNLNQSVREFLTIKANHLHFSPDNKRLLVEKIQPVRYNNKKIIYDIESKAEIYKDITSVQKIVSPNLDRIAIQGQVAIPLEEKHKKLRGKVIALEDENSYALSQTKSKFLLFDPRGNYLITEAPPLLALNYILLRNARTGAVISYLPHNYKKAVPEFSATGERLVTSTGNNLMVWKLRQLNSSSLCAREKAALLWFEYKFRHGQIIHSDEIIRSNSTNENLLSFNEETEKIAQKRYINKICYDQTPIEFKKISKSKLQAMEGKTTELVGTTQANEIINAKKVKTGPYAGVTTAVRYIFKPYASAPQSEPIDACKAKALFFAMHKKLKY